MKQEESEILDPAAAEAESSKASNSEGDNGTGNDGGSGAGGSSQSRKIFIGGLNYNTTEEGLKKHFGQYGEIVDVVVMKFPDTKRYVENKGMNTYYT